MFKKVEVAFLALKVDIMDADSDACARHWSVHCT